MYRQGIYKKQKFTGLFSPKFRLKSKISGQDFLDFATAHQEADVCLLNPFPQLAYFSFNVWMQGEHAHPGLTERAQALLDAFSMQEKLGDLAKVEREIKMEGRQMVLFLTKSK